MESDFKQVKDKNRRWYILLLFAIPLAMYFWFGMQHITEFETADEYRWVSEYEKVRIPQYWDAMFNKDWERTRINDKPGITLAMISGVGLLYEKDYAARVDVQHKFSTEYDPEKTQNVAYYFRMPILLFNGLMSVFILFSLARLTKSNWTALLGATLIVLCPVIIGISQIINPDAFLWVFFFSAILSFMLFVRDNKWWDALFSALFLGLAFLSKYTSFILVPFFFVIMLSYLFFNYKELAEEGKIRKKMLILSLSYPAIVALGVLFFALGMPAVFVNHDLLTEGLDQIKKADDVIDILLYASAFLFVDALILKSFITKNILKYSQFLGRILPALLYVGLAGMAVLAFYNWAFGGNVLGVPDIPYDARDEKLFRNLDVWNKLMLELYPFVYSLTPIVFFSLVATWLKSAWKTRREDAYILFALSSLFVAFYFGVIMQKLQVNIRYSMIMYPIAILIASLGISQIFNWEKMRNVYATVLFLAVVAVSGASLWLIKPFYFNYATDILPKQYSITGGWGYGGYEAAQYIHSQYENSEELIVWTDYDGFCPFFKGRCVKGSQIKWNKKDVTDNISFYVRSRRGAMQTEKMWEGLKEKRMEEPVWELNIDGRPANFIKIYKAADVSEQALQ